MFNQGGLSLEQAPPLSVVLRFFVTATLFGIFAGVWVLLFSQASLDSTTTAGRILTHILALGVLGSFMLGALFQMLPVIAGVVLETPTRKAMVVHVGFSMGVLLLLGAFYTTNAILFSLSGLLLGGIILHSVVMMLLRLFTLPNHSSSSKGMLFALLGFGSAALLALYLLGTLGNLIDGENYLNVKEAHYSFGLFGWVALLIVSISFQVVEMFYVTPPYPQILTKYLTPTLFGLLVLKLVLLLLKNKSIAIDMVIGGLLLFYAITTLLRLAKRKRPTSDATVWFWRFGMGMLILFLSCFIGLLFQENSLLQMLSYISFAFFALSIVFAMVYKIVPFLVWFHLSNQGYMQAPMMHDIIHPKWIKKHFYLHAALLITYLTGFLNPLLFQFAGALTIVSFGWLLYHLGYAIYLYRHTQKHSEKIVW